MTDTRRSYVPGLVPQVPKKPHTLKPIKIQGFNLPKPMFRRYQKLKPEGIQGRNQAEFIRSQPRRKPKRKQ